MAKSFTVNIVTPDKTAYEGQALSATIPGTNGYLGVWANHAPLVGGVVPGVVFLRTDESGSEKHFAVGEGFVEISDNQVNVMTATCELASEIDILRAEEALDRARKRLKSMEKDLDRERARLAVSRAEARIKAGKQG
ncbi:ATP synthase F1 subunit epsilon [bacterium DOLZORAL124_64_63]|nr:MAG: ATP synthase F1 subunit epsilon [bacterium DOLZORAL124_64_63]PID80652.1 MAG: ATP synthase F1 subunit epsilon [bacterium DOLZORAL124_64_63]